MNPNQNDNFFYEDDEDQFDPQDLTSGGSQQESQGASQGGGMGSQVSFLRFFWVCLLVVFANACLP